MPARPGDCAPGQSATTPAVPTRRATVSPALSAQSTTTASWPGSRSRPDRSSDRSDHARRDGGTRTRPRSTGDGRREGDLRDDQAHLRRSIWASRMRPTCGLVIGAPSVPDWATSNGLARPPLSVRSSRVRARPASLAPQYFKPVALGDLLSAASEARPAFDPDEARAPLDDGCASPLPDGRLPSRPRSAGLRAAAPRCSSHQRGADGLIMGGLDARCGGEAPGARNGHG